jgi:uncharacterized membrane-anchored protein YitT (DUF2179 family)
LSEPAQYFIALPIGVLMLLFNMPTFFVGYKQLGGSPFLVRSLVASWHLT